MVQFGVMHSQENQIKSAVRNTGMGVLVLPLEAERFHQENPSFSPQLTES